MSVVLFFGTTSSSAIMHQYNSKKLLMANLSSRQPDVLKSMLRRITVSPPYQIERIKRQTLSSPMWYSVSVARRPLFSAIGGKNLMVSAVINYCYCRGIEIIRFSYSKVDKNLFLPFCSASALPSRVL
jgi:hypothetical protein